MKRFRIGLCAVLIVVLGGCTTLTPQQKTEYDMMKSNQVLKEEKNPTTGAWFGLLPGGGSFYARQPGVGFLDLLAWPLSVLWDPIVGFEMSKKVNYDLTLANLEREKSKALSDLENEHDLQKLSDTDYVVRKREIEEKYDYRKEGM